MGESLNFSGHPGLPMVDFWGAEAERLALERPDLSLVRARQLTELFVYLMEFRHQQPHEGCLLYTSPSPRDQRGSRMPSSA